MTRARTSGKTDSSLLKLYPKPSNVWTQEVPSWRRRERRREGAKGRGSEEERETKREGKKGGKGGREGARERGRERGRESVCVTHE